MEAVAPPVVRKRRTWLWILLGVFGLGILGVIAIAGFGMYFLSTHVSSSSLSPADAFKQFDQVKAPFKDQQPLFQVDERERLKALRRLSELPAAKEPSRHMYVLIWSPEREKLVKLTLPFWALRLGRQKIDVGSDVFDVRRMEIDIEELKRAGSVLLLDHRDRTGQRVLIWTQ